jgi:hypothetical protein
MGLWDSIKGAANDVYSTPLRGIPGADKVMDKAWDLPGVKQVNDFTAADMALDPTHYKNRAKAEGKGAGDVALDALSMASTVAIPFTGGASLGAKGAIGGAKAASTATKAAKGAEVAADASKGAKGAEAASAASKGAKGAEAAGKGGKLKTAAKKAPTFLSGAQFGAGSGGDSQAAGYTDPVAAGVAR